MIYALAAVALVGAVFIGWSRQKPKARSSLDTPLLPPLSPNGKFVIGFSLVFGAACAALALHLKGMLL